jgi:tetratricopeptide (TPR) repeat protein
MLYCRRREVGEVLAAADRTEVHWRQARCGAREQAIANQLRGIGQELAKDYISAIETYRKVVELHRTVAPESSDVAISLNYLGCANRIAGDLEAAELHYREALRIARARDYNEGVATYTGNLAALALDRSNWSDAEALSRESLSLAEKFGRLELIAEDSCRLAEALVRQAKKGEALQHARRAVEIFGWLGSADLDGARQTLAECES